MSADLIVTAKSVITVDKDMSRAEAVAIDSSTGKITAVGALADLQKDSPDAQVQNLGDSVILPGFVDAHNHPVMSGIVCMEPSFWIAPYVGFPSYDDVKKLFVKANAEQPAGAALMFQGLDRSLQGVGELSNTDLDEFFPDRPVVVADNSGHEIYFNTAVITSLGWADNKPPADPEGSRFGRNADGTSNGRAYEVGAMLAVAGKIMAEAVPHPLLSAAKWLRTMAANGVTMTSEHTYQSSMQKALIGLTMVPAAPIRISLYHMSTEADCGAAFASPVPDSMLKKNGIKLWADGSPWVGTIASTISYLDNPTVVNAGITPGTHGEEMMNYSRAQIDAIIDAHGGDGHQFAFHCNGDIAFDIVLDAFEYGLNKFNLVGTDHRWRVEHVGAARADQFARAASLGVGISMSPFQFIYWGDILDGTLFDSEVGAQWQRVGDAVKSGAVVSFHNDGSVSPSIPLLNLKSTVTRLTPSGKLHGPEQKISLDDALRAQTINGAFHLKRDDEAGSIEVGKFADFVILDTDPYAVDPAHIDKIKVQGTWLAGKPVDGDAYLAQIEAIDPSEHKDLHAVAISKPHKC